MKSPFRLSENRQLAVVMFLDIVGYSARMASDEKNALSCVAYFESLLRGTVADFGGRLVKFMGDGSLSRFPTASSAFSCARKILNEIEKRNRLFPPRQRFQVRAGLHLGDIVPKGRDLLGDAVNVAARVQPLADPGGIAMTGSVYSQVRGLFPIKGIFLPHIRLKNIPVDIPIFCVAPPDRGFFFWKLGRGQKTFQWSLLLLILGLTPAFLGYFQAKPAPDHWALLDLSQAAGPSPPQAQAARRQAEMDLSGLPGVRWVDPEKALALFRQGGITEPAVAMERLDLAACHEAWKRNLRHLVLFRLDPLSQGLWKLDCRVVDTKGRVVVASFSAEGADVQALVGTIRREMREWIRKKG